MSNVLYIIDTMSLIFQVYHALPKDMTAPDGQPTNAVFGFARDLEMILGNGEATHVICAMESLGPGTRNEIYAEYKANRTETPEDLTPQFPVIWDVIRGFNVPAIQHEGWEADDVIATLARRAEADGFDVRVVTSDKDIRQLISPQIKLYNCRKQVFFGETELEKAWGIRPDQVIDFQSLVGDSVDNVPGVPLVGPKKAQALLEQFGTLDDVLAHADQAPGKKLRENLVTYADQARMSRELVTLQTGLPIEYDWDDARISEPDRPLLFELFTRLGFGRMSEIYRPVEGEVQRKNRSWNVIDTPRKFEKFLAELKQQSRFCFDLETTSKSEMKADIVGWAICWEPFEAYYLPVEGPGDDGTLDGASVLEGLRPFLEDPAVEVVNQNIKYDALVLRRAGVAVDGIGVDPMVGDYLLDAGARSHGLDHLAQKYLQYKMIPISDVLGEGKQQKMMFEVDVDRAAEYATEDADIALQLSDVIGQKLKDENLWELYWDLERPLISVLTEMEFNGIALDTGELKRQSDELSVRLEALMTGIYELAGREFNIGSPKQLAEVLFEEHKLHELAAEHGVRAMRKTQKKTAWSTSHDVLEKLALFHDLPAKIIDHRHLAKLKSTYLDALPEAVNAETGRVHTSFSQVVAATGRLSSNDPNLQNIPIRTEEGRRVRRAFIAGEPDWTLIAADYSQIELRLLAHFSQDEALLDAFRSGADIHTSVAAEVFGVDPGDVDSGQRRIAKAVNFGVLYGQSAFGLSEQLRIPRDEAADFISNYFSQYVGVDLYLTELLERVQQTGYAETILGRRREISGIRRTTGRSRNLPERTAINTEIQGSAADLIKTAMLRVHERLATEEHPARMLLQIHDELLFEAPRPTVDSLVSLAREEMESAFTLDVPLVVDVKVGDNWLDMVPA